MATQHYVMPSALDIEKQQVRQLFKDNGVPWENVSTVFTDAYNGNSVAQNVLQRMINDLQQGRPLTRVPGVLTRF